VLAPLFALVTGPFLLVRNVAVALVSRKPGPAPAVPAWRRLLLIAASVLTLALTARYVLKQDYEVFAEYEPVMGTVKWAGALPDGAGGFRPVVTFFYTVEGCYYERPTHAGWDGMILRKRSKEEAEAAVSSYTVGSPVLVWYNPADPLRGVLKRYARWQLYPILVPPLWVLVVQTRRLLRPS
ncbi:MAG TPA: DUF3592 domain-containing protein, partial [Urbifossiella sp.]|nr:DUF3592 domain-containing protein [Urbifossiella sp.]